MRFWRAFWGALWLTLRGQQVKSMGERRAPLLFTWIVEGQAQLAAWDAACVGAGFGTEQQRALRVRLDGREVSAETVIAALRNHLSREYVHLLEDYTEHALTAIYAYNLNDRYALSVLAESGGVPAPLMQALHTLQNHLEAIPSSQEVQSSMSVK